MRLLRGHRVFYTALPAAAAALLIVGSAQATSASTEAPAAPAAAAQRSDEGERLLNSGCGGCHDLRPIQASARNAEEWNETVQNMIQRGADVADKDVPVLVEYLVDHHGPMPDGRGKEVVLNVCTQCHDLRRIRNGHRSPEEWMETLNSMLNEGAPLSDQDYPIVLAYLARNFGH